MNPAEEKLMDYYYGNHPFEADKIARARRIVATLNEIRERRKNKPKTKTPQYKQLINYLVDNHFADIISHEKVFDNDEPEAITEGQAKYEINSVTQKVNQLEYFVLRFSTQPEQIRQQAIAIVKENFENTIKHEVQTISFAQSELKFVIIYYTPIDYPIRFEIRDAELLLTSPYETIDVILNAIQQQNQLTFNPQIYANALMMFNQTKHWRQLQKLTESSFKRIFTQLVTLQDHNDPKRYRLIEHQMRDPDYQEINTLFEQDSLNISIHWFNPIEQIQRTPLDDEIPQKLRTAITKQINE